MRLTIKAAAALAAAWIAGSWPLPAASSDDDTHRFTVRVDFGGPSVEQRPFWQSTGFSPGELLLTRDMDLTLRMIGASRGPAIRYIRPHYLLDLVDAKAGADGTAAWGWDRLDRALDTAVRNDLRLIFELMGNPGGRFDDFRQRQQFVAWRDFVRSLAQHLQERYGRDKVESWYFETTNESDIHPFWPQTAQAFLNYYDASSEGLRQANPRLRFGGPGIGRFLSPTLKQLLEHCDTGTNALTGETGVRLDFISFHQKSLPHETVRLSEHVVEYLRQYHPKFANLPLFNDEADAAGGWGIPYWWQAGTWPAAYAVQSIDLHNQVLIDRVGANLQLVGADHGFLGSWGKRTLTARLLRGNDDAEQWGSSDPGGWKPWDQGQDERPETTEFYLVRKPALTVMSLEALLGERRYPVQGFPPLQRRVDSYGSAARNLGCIATRGTDLSIVILCYNAPPLTLDAKIDGNGMAPSAAQLKVLEQSEAGITLELAGLPFEQAQLTRLQIDPQHGNPWAEWQRLGSPENPDTAAYRALQKAQEPAVLETTRVSANGGSMSLSVSLPGASVSAIVLTPPSGRSRPAAAEGLGETRYTGASGERMSFVSWRAKATPGLTLADVYYAAPGSSDFEQVNADGLLDDGVVVAGTAAGGRVKVIRRNAFGDASRASLLVLP